VLGDTRWLKGKRASGVWFFPVQRRQMFLKPLLFISAVLGICATWAFFFRALIGENAFFFFVEIFLFAKIFQLFFKKIIQ
jgi:uncharacterized membrane protein